VTDGRETERRDTVTLIGPVVWGSVWGHGPELALWLSRERRVVWIDPVIPRAAAKPSFQDRDSYPVPAGVEVIRRKSRLETGVLYGIAMELRNLSAVVRGRRGGVVTYYPLGCLLALLWCRIVRRRTLFVYADRPDVLAGKFVRWLAIRLFLPATATLAAACVATSSLLYEEVRRYNRNTVLLPNGVDLAGLPGLEAAGDEPRRFCAGFVGWFGEWVDFDLLLDTAGRLPEVDFLLVGDGPLLKEIEPRAVKLPNVRLTGALPHREVFRRIDRMDLCLVPFRIAALTDRVSPVKLFEYWARGKPVLAAGCHELKLYARRHPAALFIYEDPAGLARLIETFRRDGRLLAQAGAEAKTAVRDYDWQVIGRKIAELV